MGTNFVAGATVEAVTDVIVFRVLSQDTECLPLSLKDKAEMCKLFRKM